MNKQHYINVLKEMQSKLYSIDSSGEDTKTWYENNSAYVNNTVNKINKFIITSGSNEEYISTYKDLEKEAKKINNSIISKMNLEGNTVKVKSDLAKPLNIITKYSVRCFDYIKANYITNKSIFEFLAALLLAILIRLVVKILVRIIYAFVKACIMVIIVLLRKLFRPNENYKKKYSNISLANEIFKLLKKYRTQIGYGFLFGSMACICLIISNRQDKTDENTLKMIDLNWLKTLVDSIKDKVYVGE